MKNLRYISYIIAVLCVVFAHGLINNIAHANPPSETATEDKLNEPPGYRDINFETPCPTPSQLSNTNSLNLPVRLLRHSQRSSNFTCSRLQNGQNATSNYEKAKHYSPHTTSKTTNFPAPYHFSENHIYSNCNLRL